MRPHASSKSRLNHILDVLASRVGIISVVGLLIGVGLGVGIYIQSVVTQIDQNHTVFKDAQLRNGYVAMSDINRLILIAQDAAIADEMSPKLVGDFINAADILWVRTDNFTMVRDRGEHFASGDASIAALQRIVSIADSAIQSDFANPRLLVSNLLIAAEDARQHLVLFLDEIRRQGDLVLDQQSSVVRRQQIIMLTSLAGLTIIGSVALSLLRREVLARRARRASTIARACAMAVTTPRGRVLTTAKRNRQPRLPALRSFCPAGTWVARISFGKPARPASFT